MDPGIGVNIDLDRNIIHNNDISQPQSNNRNAYEPNYVETPSCPNITDRVSDFLFRTSWGNFLTIVGLICLFYWVYRNVK